MKRKLDTCLSSGMSKHSDTAPKLPHVPPLTDAEMKAFLAELNSTNDRPVLLSVMPDYAEQYTSIT